MEIDPSRLGRYLKLSGIPVHGREHLTLAEKTTKLNIHYPSSIAVV